MSLKAGVSVGCQPPCFQSPLHCTSTACDNSPVQQALNRESWVGAKEPGKFPRPSFPQAQKKAPHRRPDRGTLVPQGHPRIQRSATGYVFLRTLQPPMGLRATQHRAQGGAAPGWHCDDRAQSGCVPLQDPVPFLLDASEKP